MKRLRHWAIVCGLAGILLLAGCTGGPSGGENLQPDGLTDEQRKIEQETIQKELQLQVDQLIGINTDLTAEVEALRTENAKLKEKSEKSESESESSGQSQGSQSSDQPEEDVTEIDKLLTEEMDKKTTDDSGESSEGSGSQSSEPSQSPGVGE